jgi:MFS family permease
MEGKNKKIEKLHIIRGVTITHFLLMFGYKLFSLYFPLFLVARNFTLPQVGWTYLLIYLPIALFAPFAGFASRKTHPAAIMTLGLLGYAAYALGMIFITDPGQFFLWQVLLGISASLFFTASRVMLMSFPMSNSERGFSWFYNAPLWADALAPFLGALLILAGGFSVAFLSSVAIQAAGAVYCAVVLWRIPLAPAARDLSFGLFLSGWNKDVQAALRSNLGFSFLISFTVLLSGGFFTFFILFLKDVLGWSRDLIIFYGAASSAIFVLAYVLVIRWYQTDDPAKSVRQGGFVAGFFTILFGLFVPVLNIFNIFIFDFFRGSGSFICNSGRSALLNRRLHSSPGEAGALDTVFSPLGIALGSLIGGMLIGPLGYRWLFVLAGVLIIGSVMLADLAKKKTKKDG